MHLRLRLMLGALVLAAPGAGQTGPSDACREDFDRLERKLRENYVGYALVVPGRALREFHYTDHRDGHRFRAAAATGDACFFVLRDFVAYFRDPHLFIFQSTILDSSATAGRARDVERLPLTEADARTSYAERRGSLDPLEGIWYDRGLRVAVLPRPGRASELVAVVLTGDTSLWRPGAVRARFTRQPDGGYEGQVWERNFATRYVTARIYRRTLLRLSPGIWGKEFPVSAPDSGWLDPWDAHRPTIAVRGSTVIASVPSHDPAYARGLDSLVVAHAEALRRAETLVIDIRGNEGGSSWMTRSLMPYVASNPPGPARLPEGNAVMLASADQIAYARRALAGPAGPDSTPSLQRLLARMRANIGRIVPLADSLDAPDQVPRDSVILGPRCVGILMDGGTVSAAEAFLARAGRSTRVVILGERSAGAIDYQSVNIVPFQASARQWYLGYPTIAAYAVPHASRLRGDGIPPDVPMEWASVADPFGAVQRHLAAMGTRCGPGS